MQPLALRPSGFLMIEPGRLRKQGAGYPLGLPFCLLLM